MTVEELIEILSELPADKLVLGMDGETPEIIEHITYVEII